MQVLWHPQYGTKVKHNSRLPKEAQLEWKKTPNIGWSVSMLTKDVYVNLHWYLAEGAKQIPNVTLYKCLSYSTELYSFHNKESWCTSVLITVIVLCISHNKNFNSTLIIGLTVLHTYGTGAVMVSLKATFGFPVIQGQPYSLSIL